MESSWLNIWTCLTDLIQNYIISLLYPVLSRISRIIEALKISDLSSDWYTVCLAVKLTIHIHSRLLGLSDWLKTVFAAALKEILAAIKETWSQTEWKCIFVPEQPSALPHCSY